MENILDFLSNYYLVFDLISLFLIFSLIGYYASRKKEKDHEFKIDNNVNNLETLSNQINTNVSLQDLVKENKSIGNKESNNL